MNVAQLKTLVLDTVKHLGNCKRTPDIRLYDELKQYIEELNNEDFKKDFESINASCNLLKTITKISNMDSTQNQSLIEEFKQESEILLRSLRIYTKMKQHPYTPLQILLKLELLFDPILDHSKICHDTYFELSKSMIKTTHEKSIESIVLVQDKNRSMFLRELTDAPLDDIIIFLQKRNKTFYDFYNYDKITYVVFRLRNLFTYTPLSVNVYDKLCFFIDSKLREKYKLGTESLAQLLLDQFERIDEGRYRKKLIDFVDKVYSQAYKVHKAENPESDMISFYNHLDISPFIFAKFFDYIQEDPVFTEQDQGTYATLFEIYCKKLAGILPCASSQPPPHSATNCQSDKLKSTKNAGNRRSNRRHHKNNRSTATNQDNDADNDYYADEYYSTGYAKYGYQLDEDDMWRYTSNGLQYHEKWNYNANSYAHQPRRRINKQQTWINENY